ncbi:MAG: GGDEF domain-containing protein [Desulfuromonadaceae bacterium]|nr:GGDEF domain-containing protein [Desulfuromonadaceae bacterium]MDD2848390.1 GGDEF domain-containing protein [Desulfuromonadaceae bacterium]MDD4129214.1 GGDEF domain-containing protein [Desulfuromonadaceae bacterium]
MTESRLVFTISLLCVILAGYLDLQTGDRISMILLYSVPILLSSRYCGRVEGIIVAVGAAASWFVFNVLYSHPEASGAILSWNAFNRVGVFALIAYTVTLQAKLRISLEREKLRANTDRLTGLLNKGAFRDRVEGEMNRARRYNHPISLAFIDLDNFKHVNDTQGHARGDKLLQDVAETIVLTIRNTDLVARVGGDEFSVFLPETGEREVRMAIEKLVKALDIMTSQSGWQVTASIGVVTCTEVNDTYDELLGKADKLMYAAKEKGKNAAEFATV